MPMLSNKNLYFYEKESFMKSKLIKADKDTKNQKTIVEFDGNVVQALCDEDIIISLVEDEYEFNFDNAIYWTMKEGSKIYTIDFIDTESDPDNQLLQYIVEDEFGGCYLDYQRMKDDGIDAVELYNAAIGHLFISRIETMFNSWDCESIVVLNPDAIEFESNE